MGRILTIQVEITDKERAFWIWNSHQDNSSFNGVYVQAIHEGSIKDLIESEVRENLPLEQ